MSVLEKVSSVEERTEKLRRKIVELGEAERHCHHKFSQPSIISTSCSRPASMAGTCTSFSRHLIQSTVSDLARTIRTAAPFHLPRFSAKIALSSSNDLAQGPSCIFVGPIDTASQETLEALYLQARDAYYNGQPLILDDMFDRVELKLRRYGSKSVVKYPRCSLRRQLTYADAEGRRIYHRFLH